MEEVDLCGELTSKDYKVRSKEPWNPQKDLSEASIHTTAIGRHAEWTLVCLNQEADGHERFNRGVLKGGEKGQSIEEAVLQWYEEAWVGS